MIFQGSGRAADILAHAYNNAIQEVIYAEDQLGKKHKQYVDELQLFLMMMIMITIVMELKN